MQEKLVIIGARALGRETCNYAREAGFLVKGFIDDKSDALERFDGYPPVLSSVNEYKIEANDVFICALGEPRAREQYVAIITERGARFVSVVHPKAYIGLNAKIGIGTIIAPQTIIDCDVSIGNHVLVNCHSYIPHDSFLDDFVTVSPGCHMGGRVVIHRGVFLGLQTSVIPDVKIGEYSVCGAGAVVIHDVPKYTMVAGCPAEIKKKL